MTRNLNPRMLRVPAICFLLSFLLYSPVFAQRGMNADGDVMSGSNRSSGSAERQDGWMIAPNIGYESPLGDVKQSYDGSLTSGLSVMRRMGNVVYSGTVDYRAYKPKYANITYTDDGTTYFTSTFSKYRGLGLYLGVAYEIPVSPELSVYGGINGGLMLLSYKVELQGEDFSAVEEASFGRTTYLGPKAGFNLSLNKVLSVGVEARYSLGVLGANYNTRTGDGNVTKGFNSYAGNLFLMYNF